MAFTNRYNFPLNIGGNLPSWGTAEELVQDSWYVQSAEDLPAALGELDLNLLQGNI